jgi:basic amino acid/polyamine antiporter, APA family
VSASVARGPGTADAVALGLAAIVGAGVFGVWAPATAAAGGWLPLAVVVAGVAALCAAAAGADVALAHPGGCAVGGTSLLCAGAARLAGVAYLLGRAAAAATAAAVFGSYVLPDRPLAAAVGLVVVATGLAIAGVAWTVRSAWALVGGVGVVLLVVVVVGVVAAGGDEPELSAATALPVPAGPASAGTPGVLTAAGLLFFAYAGFARLFPLGVQLRDPLRTQRRVVGLTLGVAFLGYLAVAVALLAGLGAEALAAAPAPLVALVDTGGAPALGVLVRVGAAVACGSALLAVLTGWSRTTVTMAARGELPRALGVTGRRGSAWRADLLGGAVAVVVAVLAGPVGALAVAACALLVHYALVGLAAVLLPAHCRTWPAGVFAVGAVLCLLLALLLPLRGLAVTVTVLAVLWVLATLHSRRARAG